MTTDWNPPPYRAGEMLARLYESLAVLPDILLRREAWDSLIVNRRKPFTYRVFTTLPGGLRLCQEMWLYSNNLSRQTKQNLHLRQNGLGSRKRVYSSGWRPG